jgi:hypothetical protein
MKFWIQINKLIRFLEFFSLKKNFLEKFKKNNFIINNNFKFILLNFKKKL